MTIRVIVADDHRLFRRGLRALLSVEGLDVVAEVADGNEAVAAARELLPDVVLMDLQMPGGSGLDAVRRISIELPAVKSLVVTMFDDDDSVFAALRAGANGYVLKDADDDELIRAIRTVAGGGAVFSTSIATRIIGYFAAAPARPGSPFPTLTPAEAKVLEQVARGLNNDAIAQLLNYSPKTVRNYVSIILTKLHVADRAQAIALARDHGIGQRRAAGPPT